MKFTGKKVLAFAIFSIVFSSVAPAATALPLNCQLSAFQYSWPGTIDDGNSIGAVIVRRASGADSQLPDCKGSFAPFNLEGIVKSELVAAGHISFTAWPMNESAGPCTTTLKVNQTIAATAPFALVPGTSPVTFGTEAQMPKSAESLFHEGANEIRAEVSCQNSSDVPPIAIGTVRVLPKSYGLFSGITANAGSEFTNTRDVSINIAYETVIAQVAISNDGGFAADATKIFDFTQNPIPWTLKSSVSERLPKTVYVRFRGYAISNDGVFGPWIKTTYTDDIILDTVPPSIVSASASTVGTVTRMRAKPRLTLNVFAKDNKSGVGKMQINNVRKAVSSVTLPYSRRKILTFPRTATHLFLRVQDRAGNWSKWAKLY